MNFFTEIGWLSFPMVGIEMAFTSIMCFVTHRHSKKIKNNQD